MKEWQLFVENLHFVGTGEFAREAQHFLAGLIENGVGCVVQGVHLMLRHDPEQICARYEGN